MYEDVHFKPAYAKYSLFSMQTAIVIDKCQNANSYAVK